MLKSPIVLLTATALSVGACGAAPAKSPEPSPSSTAAAPAATGSPIAHVLAFGNDNVAEPLEMVPSQVTTSKGRHRAQ